MTDYSVAHASKGISFLVVTDTESGKPTVTRLKNDPASPAKSKEKAAFLEQIKEGDRVFLELGGPADRLALAAYAHGAEVLRYPSFLLNKEKTTRILELARITCKDEKATSKETSEVLTSRKMRALALSELAKTDLESFYGLSDKDLSLMRLAIAWRSYERSYKGTQRAYLGILAAYRDQTFVELALKRQMKADVADETVHNRVLELMLEDMLGGKVNKTERQDFFAMIGKEFEGGRLPARATEETIAVIVNALLESDSFRSTVFDRLKAQKKTIEQMLEGAKGKAPKKAKKGRKRVKGRDAEPANEIYTKVFEPIHGCGPLIAARLITSIGDIRRFESLPKLKAFAGYHHFEDGSRARRLAGTVSNWSPTLKQGVYLFCDITVKQRADSPWRRKLDQRKAYELYKLMYARQLKAMELDIDVEILPASFANREIKSVLDVTVADFIALAAHLEQVQKDAGVAWKGDEADDGAEDEEEVEETDAKSKRDPRLGKLVKGLKGQAHQKALRWLGQQFLKHVYKTWHRAVGQVAPGFTTEATPDLETSQVIRKDDSTSSAYDAAAPAE